MKKSLSLREARHIALAAQGMVRADREGSVNWTRMARAVGRMKLLQIDSVNVLVRSHYLPVYSRVGAFDHAALDRRTFHGKKRHFFEYWAHEASFLPLELYPLMRWRMDRALNGNGGFKSLASFAAEQRSYVKDVLGHVRANGPTAVSDLTDPGGRSGNWWGWSKGKLALEYLFETGEVMAATRRVFERLYDVPERVIPAEALNTTAWPEAEAIRELMRRSAEALGIATYTDLRDYFRLPVKEAGQALNELVADGTLIPLSVEGWKPASLPLQGCGGAPQINRGRPPLSLRSFGVGTQPDRKTVRFPLPHRDLYAGTEAYLRLLCIALPAGRPAYRADLPQGRSPSLDIEGECGALGTWSGSGRDGHGTCGGTAPDGPLARP